MKKLIAGVIVLFLCTTQLGYYYSINAWKEKKVDRLRRVTVQIVVNLDENNAIMGAGVLISKDGLILTAAHVVNSKEKCTIYVIHKNTHVYLGEVIGVDTRHDLALLHITESAQKFEYAEIQKKKHLWVGQNVLIIGHPLSHDWMVSIGHISNISFMFKYFCLVGETTAFVNPGSSGGPVFNSKGEVIGIVSAMYVSMFHEPIGIGIFVPVKQIHSFLKEMKPKIKPNKPPRIRIGDIK